MHLLPDLIAVLGDSSYLLIRGRVRATLWKYRQLGLAPEAGGVLLGSYRGGHIEVTHASIPGKGDVRRRNEFIRKDCCHQQLSDSLWERSSGEIIYIGEWHTHPTAIPSPSARDYKEWYAKLPMATMVLLIQGLHGLRVDMLEVVNGKKYIRQLSPIEV